MFGLFFGFLQSPAHGIERPRQMAHFIVRGGFDTGVEISFTDFNDRIPKYS